MQLVDDHPPETAEHPWCFRHRNEQRHLLGGGDQDVGWAVPLALAFRRWRVAGPGLDADREPHLADRLFEIACDIDRQSLERRHIERVQPLSGSRRELAE
jgi:hypothetical protein